MYVVIALSPTVDVSQVAGPFRSMDRAYAAADELRAKGYNTVEVCPLLSVADIGYPRAPHSDFD